ncbi:matrixin family metalloprotease [Cellulomonas sp. ATA003]|uniref:matrixin family metalloprotease n=1 Tax=Cellulomonas sp. ATA003 TaxID=3073064 RepID=UPI0028733935|nr:matrixin family metalloprotease [Cellulomonas sp. ATA003]WNB86525.1 matrixin family metalloprotease [Cellulomonas sp. ATA003]
MPLPLDDLPRSPTGRVPQWVLDEATGHSRVVDGWRQHASPVGYRAGRPVANPRRPIVRRGFVVALIATLVGAGVVVVGLSPDHGAGVRRAIEDWAWTAQRGPLPPAGSRRFPAPGYEEQATRVLAGPVPPATGGSHEFSGTQTPDGAQAPVTWSPCRPIHYVVDATGAPPTFAADVGRAVAELSAATGLSFVDDGATTEGPADSRESFQPDRYGDRWAPVLIGVTGPATVPDLAGDVAGVGGATSAVDPRTGTMHYVSGIVYLDVDVFLKPPTTAEPAYLPILRHELGHLVGLAHTEDSTQLMHPVTSDVVSFQAGDLAGLAALGRGPCAPGL